MIDNTRTGIIMIAVAVVLLTVALLVLAAKDRAQDEQLAAGVGASLKSSSARGWLIYD